MNIKDIDKNQMYNVELHVMNFRIDKMSKQKKFPLYQPQSM